MLYVVDWLTSLCDVLLWRLKGQRAMNRQQSGEDIYHTMGDGEELFFSRLFLGCIPSRILLQHNNFYKFVIAGGKPDTFKYV